MDTWEDNRILPSTMRLYSKKIPAREASRQFVASVMRQVNVSDRLEKNAEDVQKSMYSHHDWVNASESVSLQLEKKVKEPKTLLFFRGAIFEMTFNVEGEFSNTQTAILFELPSQEDLSNWRKIKVLKTPLGLREIVFDPLLSKEAYLERGYIEVEVGPAPERAQNFPGNIQGKRKQYGLKHHVTSTIHAAMGDTLSSMATEISFSNSNFNMWDKGQMIVILSRTKGAEDTIFVGDKNDTLLALKHLLKRRTQWTDYMEEVLKLITVEQIHEQTAHTREQVGRTEDQVGHTGDQAGHTEELSDPTHEQAGYTYEQIGHTQEQASYTQYQVGRRIMTQSSFPYRICDVSLPQCNTGYVYMLISVRDQNFSYIGKTFSIRQRIQQHNSGNGSVSTEPFHLRPYALFAYICGFKRNNELLFFFEREWKRKRDRLIINGVNDLKSWAYSAHEIISGVDVENFGVQPSDLSLICLFR